MENGEMLLLKQLKQFKSFASLSEEKNGISIYSGKEFRRILELERERAERSSLRFSLVVVDLRFYGRNNGANLKIIINKISESVRKIDQVGWCDENKIGILLPYTPTEGADELVAKICRKMEQSLLEFTWSVYTYPTIRDAEIKANKAI